MIPAVWALFGSRAVDQAVVEERLRSGVIPVPPIDAGAYQLYVAY